MVTVINVGHAIDIADLQYYCCCFHNYNCMISITIVIKLAISSFMCITSTVSVLTCFLTRFVVVAVAIAVAVVFVTVTVTTVGYVATIAIVSLMVLLL